ncbi:hypothetical protein GJ496_002854 [Pomphorhynchus laevis]|nr:hypothetical protein GJ496_002854 [Pomphorhynchus laevis]
MNLVNDPSSVNKNICFIAVHCGAGYHSPRKSLIYKQVCSTACRKAMVALHNGQTCDAACVLAVKILEDCAETNAGFGSNLTINGTVECDASVMDENGFGAVGAVQSCMNPILIAQSILDKERLGKMSAGRIPPCLLVSSGAIEWARQHDVDLCEPSKLISDKALRQFREYSKQLSVIRKRKHFDEINDDDRTSRKRYDTVGAIAIDNNGNVASAISSGGIVLKQAGRVGSAAHYGAGCWIENSTDQRYLRHKGACATSGCGEYLIKTMLAMNFTRKIISLNKDIDVDDIKKTVCDAFIDSDRLHTDDDRFMGLIAIRVQSSLESQHKFLEFIAVHTTKSFCFAYQNEGDSDPEVNISRMPDNLVGKDVCCFLAKTNFSKNTLH